MGEGVSHTYFIACEALFHYHEHCVTQHSDDLHSVMKLV